jgi:hypothetical protein
METGLNRDLPPLSIFSPGAEQSQRQRSEDFKGRNADSNVGIFQDFPGFSRIFIRKKEQRVKTTVIL